MSQPAASASSAILQHLAEELLACSEEQLESWLQQNQASLSLRFIQHLKDTYATAEKIQENPQLADRATRYGLLAAQFMTEDAEMLALAQWARGMWASYYAPASAVALFRSALTFYGAQHEQLSQARLLANLVAVLAECGANQEAEACYHAAHALLVDLADVDPKYLLYLELHFGWLLHNWGRFAEALVVYDRGLALATQQQMAIGATEIQVNRYLTLGRLGRFDESEQGLRQERERAEQQNHQLTVARIDLNLGELYTIGGRPADALRCFQQAERGFAATDNPMEQSVVLALQATLLRQLGAWQVARRQYQTALTVLEQHNLQTMRGETLVNLAICLRLLGGKKQLQSSLALLKQAHAFWTKSENHYWMARVYFEQILVAQAQNKIDHALQLLATPPPLPANQSLQAEFKLLAADLLCQAPTGPSHPAKIIQDYTTVIDFASAQGIHWLRRQALHGLGKFYLPSQGSKGRELLEAAAATDDQIRQSLSLQELKARFHEQANDLFDELIRHAYQQGDYGLVLLYTWRAKASAFLDLVSSVRSEYSAPLEQRQAIAQLRQQIATLRWTLAAAAERNLLDARYEAASPELASLEEKLLELRLQTTQQQSPNSKLTSERVTELLQQMDAAILLEYVRCGDELYGICATLTGVCVVVQLADVATIAEIAGQLALTFHSFNALTSSQREQMVATRSTESQALLRRCYELLVAPFQPYLSATQATDKILVAPCDVLTLLPFAAFWTGSNYWIEEQALEFMQSGALLALEPAQMANYSPPLVIAASTGQATAVRQEAAALLDVLAESVTFIDAPVLPYWAGLQSPPRLVHIAAHTLQRGDAPLFTAIQLHGEVLSVEQSYELPLWGTELVTLSGCTTASGMESEASLFAFQSAFLIAGAQRVLCTLWPIADGMAGALMRHFYTLLQEGLTAPAALRQTQLDFLRQNNSYRHPALWAAFTCVRR
ncbi:MAG: CHAT domain-containing protein [Caldilineaceae bacterium]